jgi:serine/threonine protein kinase
MQHDFEGAEAVLYVRNGTVVRRLKKAPSPHTVRMKAIDALLSLCHANLVRILQISPDGEMHMEGMQVSLQRHMLAGQTCSVGAKLRIARHVSSGLQHLHQHDMQHEDLCPNNILLAWRHGQMHVKLCDFYNGLQPHGRLRRPRGRALARRRRHISRRRVDLCVLPALPRGR